MFSIFLTNCSEYLVLATNLCNFAILTCSVALFLLAFFVGSFVPFRIFFSEMLICSFIILSQFNRSSNIRKKLNKLHDHTIDNFVLVIVLHMHSKTKLRTVRSFLFYIVHIFWHNHKQYIYYK